MIDWNWTEIEWNGENIGANVQGMEKNGSKSSTPYVGMEGKRLFLPVCSIPFFVSGFKLG